MYDYILYSVEVVSHEIMNNELGETKDLASSLIRCLDISKPWDFPSFVFVFIFSSRNNYLLDL